MQLRFVAEVLGREDIQRIYTSPLERTRESAEILGRAWQVEVNTAPELLEVDFGKWSNQKFANLRSDPDWKRYNQLRSISAPPSGEHVIQILSRTLLFIDELREKHSGEAIALVSHGDVLRSLLCYFMGMPIDHILRIKVELGSISKVRLFENDLQIEYLNLRAENAGAGTAIA